MKQKSPIKYHISSSVWSSIKHKYQEATLNSSWLLGNGRDINFWTDLWCGQPIVNTLNLPMEFHTCLKASIHLFINNSSWNIPQIFYHRFPNMQDIIEKDIIPAMERDDQFIWNHSRDGDMTFKEAYQFQCKVGQNILWAKSFWNIVIPPSKSFMV